MKHYLVVGGSFGIGLALTQLLAAEGNFVHATFNTHPIDSALENTAYYKLNVLDETIDVSFLPENLDGVV